MRLAACSTPCELRGGPEHQVEQSPTTYADTIRGKVKLKGFTRLEQVRLTGHTST